MALISEKQDSCPRCGCRYQTELYRKNGTRPLYWCVQCGSLINSSFENGYLPPIDAEMIENSESAAGKSSE